MSQSVAVLRCESEPIGTVAVLTGVWMFMRGRCGVSRLCPGRKCRVVSVESSRARALAVCTLVSVLSSLKRRVARQVCVAPLRQRRVVVCFASCRCCQTPTCIARASSGVSIVWYGVGFWACVRAEWGALACVSLVIRQESASIGAAGALRQSPCVVDHFLETWLVLPRL